MHREYHHWPSRSLGREMELLVFGHGGVPLIVFPTSAGRFHDYEDRGMVAAVADKLEAGVLQLYCVDSVDAESWYDRTLHPRDRLRRHLQYEDFILNDMVPLIRHLRQQPPIGVTGCGFGGYHAMALALRHPYTFTTCITMGASFDISPYLDGYHDEDGYFLNPPAFVANLTDPYYLDQYRRNKFVLATGEDDVCRGANEAFAALLGERQVPHSLHVWGGGTRHDWPAWQAMAAAYLP